MKRIRCVTDAMAVEQRQCGCSGQRTCLVCAPGSCKEPNVADRTFLQCCKCGKVGTSEHFVQTEEECCAFLSRCKIPCVAAPVLDASVGNACKECGEFSGVCLYKDFLTNAAEKKILENMEKSPWAMSQSGRMKQDFGPKANFKKRKIKLGAFNGLPAYAEDLVHQFCSTVQELAGFVPVELCNLDYDSARGSVIVPHLDDSWLWGARLVTLNLISHTLLTFTCPCGVVSVCVPLLRGSLVVVSGTSRYLWLHSIRREHVVGRRVAMTFRELSDEFKDGGQEEELGKQVLAIARTFSGTPVNTFK